MLERARGRNQTAAPNGYRVIHVIYDFQLTRKTPFRNEARNWRIHFCQLIFLAETQDKQREREREREKEEREREREKEGRGREGERA